MYLGFDVIGVLGRERERSCYRRYQNKSLAFTTFTIHHFVQRHSTDNIIESANFFLCHLNYNQPNYIPCRDNLTKPL